MNFFPKEQNCKELLFPSLLLHSESDEGVDNNRPDVPLVIVSFAFSSERIHAVVG